jgi:hypothetical protein
MKVVYFPVIFALRSPVAVPDVLLVHQQQVGLATVRMGFSEKFSVDVLAILTSELESTEGIKPVGMPVVIINGHFRDHSGSHPSALAISAANAKRISEALVSGSGTPGQLVEHKSELLSITSERAHADRAPLKVGSSIGALGYRRRSGRHEGWSGCTGKVTSYFRRLASTLGLRETSPGVVDPEIFGFRMSCCWMCLSNHWRQAYDLRE